MKRRDFPKGSRILVGMSGGVDSCAAALLLKQQGYDISGLTLILCPDSSPDDQNIADAKAVCAALGIKHYTLDLRERFNSTVMRNFADEYSNGRTPNPCIICNREIKFGAMLDYALENGFDAIATGHYADIVQDENGNCRIAKAPTAKDQSYVLWQLSEHQRAHTLLPLADYTKEELRQIVKESGLPVHSKPDSQDICFIPDGNYVDFLRRYADITPQPGNFIDAEGKVIGRHKGTICYTIGQRKGLGGGFPEPKYVTRLNMQTNEITLGGEGSQYASRMICNQVNLHFGAKDLPIEDCAAKDCLAEDRIAQNSPVKDCAAENHPAEDTLARENSVENHSAEDYSAENTVRTFTAQVKHRYAARPSTARITLSPDGNECEIVFDQPQRALTPGQSAVFYDGDLLLGGAVILQVIE